MELQVLLTVDTGTREGRILAVMTQTTPFGAALQEALDGSPVGVTGLAKTLGVSRGAVYKWLHGESLPAPERVAEIEEVLRVPTGTLRDPFLKGRSLVDAPEMPRFVQPTFRTPTDVRGVNDEELDDLRSWTSDRYDQLIRSRLEQATDIAARQLEVRGFRFEEPEGVGRPDLVAQDPSGERWVIEVKTITPETARAEVQRALGQLLMYRREFDADHLMLFTDFPLDSGVVELLEENSITTAWPGDWSMLDRNGR